MKARSLVERTGIIFVTLLFAAGLILFRLYEKQIIEHGEFVQAAKAQSENITVQPAERGRILAPDRDGRLYALSVSQWRYQLQISPRQVKNKAKLVELLKQDWPGLDAQATFDKINNDKIYIAPIAKDLDGETARKISDSNYAGVFLKPTLVRVYPEGATIASQVIGFVGGDGQGKYGVESVYESALRGRSGNEQSKRDSLGRLIDVLGRTTATAGSDIVLTLDYNLQYTVETKLKEALSRYQAASGSIVVMEPKTGAILAMAGQPTFDPNTYNLLRGDELRNFLSPAASDIYEAGSVVKPITMAAAIDAGVLTPETTNVFGRSVTVLGKEIFNAKKDAFGKETMTQVLENSDNVAMVWISNLLGSDKERSYFEKFGFGSSTGLDIIGEQSGRLPGKAEWNDLLRATAAFGQGVSTSVVQLATAYSVIANGGTLVTPHVVAKFQTGDEATKPDLKTRGTVISAETAAKVRTMLVSVVENGHGKRAGVAGLKVGGKTGTAQIPDDKGGYHEDQHIGTFAGLFPADDPKFVMVVRLNNPKAVNFAESSAAPTFGEIANWITNYYQLR